MAPPVSRTPVKWTKQMMARLGRVPDAELAAVFGCGLQTVWRKRQELGIGGLGHAKFDWTPARLARLGNVFDKELARAWGLATPTVMRQREARGIAPFDPVAQWLTPDREAVQGTAPDRALARACDADVAAELGITPAQVGRRRHELGRDAWGPGRRWTAREDRLLGKQTDRAVADRLGLSPTTVAERPHHAGRRGGTRFRGVVGGVRGGTRGERRTTGPAFTDRANAGGRIGR